MFEVKEMVKASDVWATAKDFIDEGAMPGLVRGYNIEVFREKDNQTFWMSCVYIYNNIETFVNSLDNYYRYYLLELGVKPTGRVCFRGYGIESYDSDMRDTYILDCDKNGNLLEERYVDMVHEMHR